MFGKLYVVQDNKLTTIQLSKSQQTLNKHCLSIIDEFSDTCTPSVSFEDHEVCFSTLSLGLCHLLVCLLPLSRENDFE